MIVTTATNRYELLFYRVSKNAKIVFDLLVTLR